MQIPSRPRLRSTQGCLTCRKRRKKCDETKPGCISCRRIGQQCRWVVDPNLEGVDMLVKGFDPAFIVLLRRIHAVPILYTTLDLSPFRAQICAAYTLETYFQVCYRVPVPLTADAIRQGSNSSFDQIESGQNGWTIQSTLGFAPVCDSLAWKCLVAYGMLSVGHRYRNAGLIEAGMAHWGQVVKSVCTATMSDDKRCQFDTLAAINNLGMLAVSTEVSSSVLFMIGRGSSTDDQ